MADSLSARGCGGVLSVSGRSVYRLLCRANSRILCSGTGEGSGTLCPLILVSFPFVRIFRLCEVWGARPAVPDRALVHRTPAGTGFGPSGVDPSRGALEETPHYMRRMKALFSARRVRGGVLRSGRYFSGRFTACSSCRLRGADRRSSLRAGRCLVACRSSRFCGSMRRPPGWRRAGHRAYRRRDRRQALAVR